MRSCIDVDIVNQQHRPIYQHFLSLAVAKEILTHMEDFVDIEAARYIFLFGGIENLDQYVNHCLFLVIAVKMAGKLLAQPLQSSMWKEGGHMLRVRVFFDYLVVEVQLAEEEAIAMQRSM